MWKGIGIVEGGRGESGRRNVVGDGECGRVDEGARGGIINENRKNGLDMKVSVK